MRRQPAPKEGEEEGKGQEGRKREVSVCLGDFFPGRQADRGLAPPFHPPRAKSHLPGVRLKTGGRGDSGIERERQQPPPLAMHETKC